MCTLSLVRGVGNEGLLYILWDTEARCRMFGERLPDHEGGWWSQNEENLQYFWFNIMGMLCVASQVNVSQCTLHTNWDIIAIHEMLAFCCSFCLCYSMADNQMQSERR